MPFSSWRLVSLFHFFFCFIQILMFSRQRAVTTALWCNFLVFSLKFGVWFVSSSHVMLAEVIHSVADFANQVNSPLPFSCLLTFCAGLPRVSPLLLYGCQKWSTKLMLSYRHFLHMVWVVQSVHQMLCTREFSLYTS